MRNRALFVAVHTVLVANIKPKSAASLRDKAQRTSDIDLEWLVLRDKCRAFLKMTSKTGQIVPWTYGPLALTPPRRMLQGSPNK